MKEAASSERPVTDEEVAVAEAAYDAINRGSLQDFLAAIHPEVEFRSLIAEADGQTYRGHEGVREWWKVLEVLGGLDFDAKEIGAAGAGIWVKLVVSSSVDGVTVPQTMWQAGELRDGLPVWWVTFRSEEEAAAALRARAGG